MSDLIFETFICSNDDCLSRNIWSLTDSIPQEHRHIVASCQELRQTLMPATPSIIICDLRECSDTARSELSQLCTGDRKYLCICICSEGQSGFKAINSRRLSDRFEPLEFQLIYFAEVQELINSASDLMFGYIKRERVEKYVSETLCRLGIPKRRRGHEYLTCAVTDVILDPFLGTLITKALYPDVSKRTSSSVEAIEHAIRIQISEAYTGGYKTVIDNLFHARKYKNNVPTSAEFISWTADIIRAEIKRINQVYDPEGSWNQETEFRFAPAIGGDTYRDESIEF